MSSLTRLFLRDNGLSDAGLRRLTAPVRVLSKGLENLRALDLSYNPQVTGFGARCVLRLRSLCYLDLTGTGLTDVDAVIQDSRSRSRFVRSPEPLGVFDHCSCLTEGWAKQTILQWEQAAAEATKTQEVPTSMLAPQHFYGRTRRTGAEGRTRAEPGTRASVHLQFYKERRETPSSSSSSSSSSSCGTAEGAGSSQPSGKRPRPEGGAESFAKQRRLLLTADDWTLLNSY